MNLHPTRAAASAAYAAVIGVRRQGTLTERVEALTALQAARNVLDACEAELLTQLSAIELVDDEDGMVTERHHQAGHQEFDAPELASPCLGVSTQVATGRMMSSIDLVTRFPGLIEAMAAGELDGYRARVIADELANATPEVADAVVADLKQKATERGAWETSGPLRRRAATLLLRRDPAAAKERATVEKAARGLRRHIENSHLDKWEGFLPVGDSRLAWDAVDTRARELLAHGDAPTLAAARADALVQLVMGQVTATIHLHPTIPTEPDGDSGLDGGFDAGGSPEPAPAAPESSGDGPTDDGPEPTSPEPASDSGGTDSDDTGVAGNPNATAEIGTGTGKTLAQQVVAAWTGSGDLVALRGFAGPGTVFVTGEWLAEKLASGVAVFAEPVTCHPNTGGVIGGGVSPTRQRRTGVPTGDPDIGDHDTSDDANLDGVQGVEPRYRPSQRLREQVKLRDAKCRFPGCSTRGRFADLDHVNPWPSGPTALVNLMGLCRRHHQIKQRPHWRVTLHPDGTVTWWYPDGRTATTDPVDHLEHARPLPTAEGTPVSTDEGTPLPADGEADDAEARSVHSRRQELPDTPYGIDQHSPLVEHFTRLIGDHAHDTKQEITARRKAMALAEWERQQPTKGPIPTITLGNGIVVSTHPWARREVLTGRRFADKHYGKTRPAKAPRDAHGRPLRQRRRNRKSPAARVPAHLPRPELFHHVFDLEDLPLQELVKYW